MEVDGMIPGKQSLSNEADDDCKTCEMEEQQAARVEVRGQKKKSDTSRVRGNAGLCP